MTITALLITLLRLIHIVAAVVWVGGGIFFLAVVAPAAQAAGPEGGKFMQMVARQGRLGKLMAAVSGLTFLSGLILYPLLSYHNRLGTLGGWLLTIGAVIGLLGFVHGMLVTGKAGNQMTAMVRAMDARQGPPDPDTMKQLQALGAKQAQAAVHSVILTSLALLFMAAAQTL
jgi:uncharacterized membrane protein